MSRNFNGTTDCIQIRDGGALYNVRAFNLSAWVNPSNFDGYNIVLIRDVIGSASLRTFALFLNIGDGRVLGQFTSNGQYITATSTTGIPLNAWSLIGVTYDGATLSVYVNGVLAGSIVTAAIPDIGSATYIGADLGVGGDRFAGEIAEVVLGTGSTTIGYWPLYGVQNPEPDCSTSGGVNGGKPNGNNGVCYGTSQGSEPPIAQPSSPLTETAPGTTFFLAQSLSVNYSATGTGNSFNGQTSAAIYGLTVGAAYEITVGSGGSVTLSWPGPNPPPPPPPPPPGIVGRIVWASAAGIVLDANPAMNLCTDNTAALQALLDSYGASGQPWTLVMDGLAGVDSLNIWPNTTIEGYAGGGFLRIGNSTLVNGVAAGPRPGTLQGGVLNNKHQTLGPSGPLDSNIVLRGLYIDANRRNGGSRNVGWTPTLAANNPTGDQAISTNPTGGFAPAAVSMLGVTNLVMEDVYVYDQIAFAFMLGNVNGASGRNLSAYAAPPSASNAAFYNNDCFHLLGYCQNIHLDGMHGSTSDDPWAVNAAEGGDAGTGGPIENVLLENMWFVPQDPNYQTTPGRFSSLSSANPIRNVTIRNLTAYCHEGSTAGAGITLDSTVYGFTDPAHRGDYHDILLDGIRLISPQGYGLIYLGNAAIDTLIIHGVRVRGDESVVNGDLAAALIVGNGATVGNLVIRDTCVIDPSGNIAVPLVRLSNNSQVGRLTLSDSFWSASQPPPLVVIDAGSSVTTGEGY